MTNILIKSAIALSLGVTFGPALAQTEQPAQGQSAECPAGTECPQPGGGAEQGMQPDAQGGAAGQATEQAQQPETDPAQQGGQAGAETQLEGQAGAETQQQPEGEAQQQEGQTGSETQQPEGEAQQQEGAEQPEAETQQTQEGQTTEQTTEQTTDVDVTVEQKTEITQVIREQDVEPIDVDFEVSVGTAVPETVKVRLQPVPQRIVQIVPVYEGYLFFVLADGRIVIVHPSTLEIVLIIA